MADATPTLSDRLAASLEVFDPGVPEGSVVRFTLTAQDGHDYEGRSFPGAAIWMGDYWQVTPGNPLIASKGHEHSDFMKVLARQRATDVELAVNWEALKA